jgi:hypothetical protein
MTNSDDNQIFTHLIPNFTHRTGVHCTSSALRNVFEFHGAKMSEAMIFGLGNGMTLGYLKIPRMEPFFGGRNKDFVKDLCSTLNITLNHFTSKKAEEGWQRLKNRLETNIPSVIDIDMGFLGYQKKDLPSEDFHFGGHTIAVCGYDSQTESVLVTDTHFSDVLQVPVAELSAGRNSTVDRFMAPNNSIYEFSFPEKIPDLDMIIENVLYKTGSLLLTQSGRALRFMGIHTGIKGIEAFIKDLDKWTKLPKDKFRFRCTQQAGFIGTKEENYGTGGGLFRYLFAEFLKEVASELNIESLYELSNSYLELGEKWEKVASLFKQTSSLDKIDNQNELLREIKKELTEIQKLEEEGAFKLKNFKKP